MILITGDTHGDLTRFGKRAVKKLKKNDALIICGDFGFIWDGSAAEKKRLQHPFRRGSSRKFRGASEVRNGGVVRRPYPSYQRKFKAAYERSGF